MATAKSKTAGPATRGLRVTTKRDGFRRAGIEWAGTTTVALSDLTAAQVDAIKAETTMLIVDEVDIEAVEA